VLRRVDLGLQSELAAPVCRLVPPIRMFDCGPFADSGNSLRCNVTLFSPLSFKFVADTNADTGEA
jgi:hypothetical protein